MSLSVPLSTLAFPHAVRKIKDPADSLRFILGDESGLGFSLRRSIQHESCSLKETSCSACGQRYGANPQSDKGLSRHHIVPKRYYYRCPAIVILCRGCHHRLEGRLRQNLRNEILEGRLESLLRVTSILKLVQRKYFNPANLPGMREVAAVSCETVNGFIEFSLSTRRKALVGIN